MTTVFRRIACLSSVASMVLLLTGVAVSGGSKSKTALSASTAGSSATGSAAFKNRGGHSGASLKIRVAGLAADSGFKVLCGGAHVADIATNGGGGGKVRLRAGDRRSSRDEPLDFDPGACTLVVADTEGGPILEGDVPDTGTEEPSVSASPSVSPFDGDPEDDPSVSPSASASVSPVDGGDGDGTQEDEPSASVSPSASPADGEPSADPSASASASVSEDDVSPSVSDDEQPSPSESDGDDEEVSPSVSEDEDDTSGPGGGD